MAYVFFAVCLSRCLDHQGGVPPMPPGPHAPTNPSTEGFHVAPGEEFGGLLLGALGKHVGAKDAQLKIETGSDGEGRVC